MTGSRIKAAIGQARQRSDVQLVRQCLDGNEEAWATLIEKYKNLIYSIPIKYRFSTDDASDIFQAVCLDLLAELPRLREPRALPAWLIQVTSHKCFHWKRQQQRHVAADTESQQPPPGGQQAEKPEDLAHQTEKEQALREAMPELPPRCRQLIHMLFFETPPRPYQEVARALGLATGSLGFIRRRCLEKLRRRLEKKGFR